MTDKEHSSDEPLSELRFVTPRVTPNEAAAVSAVLHGLVREETDSLRAAPAGAQTAWQASQRALRPTTASGSTRWRSFTG